MGLCGNFSCLLQAEATQGVNALGPKSSVAVFFLRQYFVQAIVALRWYSSVNFCFCVQQNVIAGLAGRLFSFICSFYCLGCLALFLETEAILSVIFPRG